MKLQFYLRFHTRYGQRLWITGNLPELGNGNPEQAPAMTYLNEEFWTFSIEVRRKELPARLQYHYRLQNEDGTWVDDWEQHRELTGIAKDKETGEWQLVDTWNHAGEYENSFYTAPFREVLLKRARSRRAKTNTTGNRTHIFRVKSPLLAKDEVICMTGSGEALGDWNTESPLLLQAEEAWWTLPMDLSAASFPLAYKYGVYNTAEKRFVRYEDGNNRLIYGDAAAGKCTVLHDGFAHLPNQGWKGAGVAIPVFSLRSNSGFGVGEFNDIPGLVDWARQTGLRLIQLLPINDTMSTGTWQDSYPYGAISAFALHPLYIHLPAVAGRELAAQLRPLRARQKELNESPVVDYEQVIRYKYEMLRILYDLLGRECLESEDFRAFFRDNRHWLEPYAVFCFFRDKYKTARFETWKTNSIFRQEDIDKLCAPRSAQYTAIAFHYFVQYHLHRQLREAVEYAHKKGIVLKGDIPIGINRNSCDAWVQPELYNMDWQAGAPPDDFTAVGQNWGFPTYNWKRMRDDGFAWWKQRFEQMSNYFDAFRIDHILGFFRIWSIPIHATQGIMGRFVPCVPVHINEFGERGIWFDYQRYCRPFINDAVLGQEFGDLATRVRDEFLVANPFGGYDLAEAFETQRQVTDHFAALEDSGENRRLRSGLLDLIANVILFDDPEQPGVHYHFRIAMDKTLSFRYLDGGTQQKLKDLYVDYFFRRQDDFWQQEAMQKLPALKAATNMLVCGEDLGMVPDCVPDVMRQLGLLSLEIQRMPKDPKKEFFHPNDAPYLSVVTPSTHDMSTVRGWWEENPERTRHFFNEVMGQTGEAPYFCEAWVNRAIVLQHLYSPAMWSIFQLQDILGMSETLRRENPHEERINNPANPQHYWQYRMHLTLEELKKQKDFNEELKGYVENSGRG